MRYKVCALILLHRTNYRLKYMERAIVLYAYHNGKKKKKKKIEML